MWVNTPKLNPSAYSRAMLATLVGHVNLGRRCGCWGSDQQVSQDGGHGSEWSARAGGCGLCPHSLLNARFAQTET